MQAATIYLQYLSNTQWNTREYSNLDNFSKESQIYIYIYTLNINTIAMLFTLFLFSVVEPLFNILITF